MDTKILQEFIVNKGEELTSVVKNISPKIWEAYYYQQFVIGLYTILWLLFGAFFVVVTGMVFKKKPKWALDYDGSNVLGFFLFAVSFFVLLSGFFSFFAQGLPRFMNPDYYTIKHLLDLGR